MSTRSIGLSIAKLIGLTALLLAAASLGTASQDNSSVGENESSNATAAALPGVKAPTSDLEPLKVSGPADVKGLWNVSLAGVQITLALNQSEDSLFGRAKFEGDHPWNGVLAGSISGKQVYIALAAMQGNLLVSTVLIGAADGDIIQGSYVRSDSEGRAAKGDMRGERFNLETEGYTPAIEEAAPQPAPAEVPQAAKEEPAVQSTSLRGAFKDVRELAKGINPNIMPSSVPL